MDGINSKDGVKEVLSEMNRCVDCNIRLNYGIIHLDMVVYDYKIFFFLLYILFVY